jgi:hypothetical protein
MILTKNDVFSAINQLGQADYREHYMIVYPDLNTLREIYSRYIKFQLAEHNEIVLVIPCYETTDTVRRVLSEKKKNDDDDANNNDNGLPYIDVQKYENEGSLVIIDSAKAYFKLELGLESFIQKLVKQAESLGKNGVSVITDAGSFSLFAGREKLVDYELSLPSKYDHGIKLKRFCVNNQKDFEKLVKEQKEKLIEHHGKNILIIN